MGYSLFWLAIRGRPASDTLTLRNLRPTGQRETIPESPFTLAHLPDGWHVVVANRLDHPAKLPLDRLSAGSGVDLVTCFVEEHVMVSSASGWHDGSRVWSVEYEAEKDAHHLHAEGDLPAPYTAIRDRLHSLQTSTGDAEGVDYLFNVPVELAYALTGFLHHADLPGVTFETLTRPSILWRLFSFGRGRGHE